MTPTESLITNIKGLMGENGVSQAELGRWLGISQASVAKRLTSRTVVLSVSELEVISERFGVPIQSLFDPPRTPVPFQSRMKEAGRPEGRPAEVAGAGFEPATSGLCVEGYVLDGLAALEAWANREQVNS